MNLDKSVGTLRGLMDNRDDVKEVLKIDKVYDNIGSPCDYVSAQEFGDKYSHVTVLTIGEFTQAIAGADLGFGKQIYNFPVGAIKCKRAKIDLTISAPTETAVGEVGLGTVVASGAVSVLQGTGEFEDIVDGFANTAIDEDGAVTVTRVECEAGILDGSETAIDVFLNFAGGWTSGDAEESEDITISGTVTLFWDFLG